MGAYNILITTWINMTSGGASVHATVVEYSIRARADAALKAVNDAMREDTTFGVYRTAIALYPEDAKW